MSAHWSRVASQTQQYFNRLGVYLDPRQARVTGALMHYNRPMSAAVLRAVMEETYAPELSREFLDGLRRKLERLPIKVRELEDGRICVTDTDKLPDFPPVHFVAKTLLLALSIPMLVMMTANAIAALCAPAKEVEKTLAEKHGEYAVAAGVAQDGRLMQFYAGKEGTSWTIVKTDTNGLACLVDSGEDWMGIPAKAVEKDPGA